MVFGVELERFLRKANKPSEPAAQGFGTFQVGVLGRKDDVSSNGDERLWLDHQVEADEFDDR